MILLVVNIECQVTFAPTCVYFVHVSCNHRKQAIYQVLEELFVLVVLQAGSVNELNCASNLEPD